MNNSRSSQIFIANNELEIVELLNEIAKIPEKSLLDRIISYCEKFDLDPKEIGDTLEESEQFKKMLHVELEKNHVFPKSVQDTTDITIWD